MTCREDCLYSVLPTFVLSQVNSGMAIVKFLKSRHKFPYCSVARSEISIVKL